MFRINFSVLAVAVLFSSSLPAATVAFLELTGPDGRPVVLEENGRFAHVAVRYKGWLHAYPGRGVEIIPSLGVISTKVVYLSNAAVPAPTREQVEPLLGRKFDRLFRWNSEDTMYCARLACELFGIAPSPMHFAGDPWKHGDHGQRGQLGSSPDKLFAELKNQGWTEIAYCPSALEATPAALFPIKHLGSSKIWTDASEVLKTDVSKSSKDNN